MSVSSCGVCLQYMCWPDSMQTRPIIRSYGRTESIDLIRTERHLAYLGATTMKSSLVDSRRGAAAMAPAALEAAVAVNDFIYMSEGTSNSYLVVTAGGNVVINTGMGFEAPHHKKLFGEVSDAPLRYIILTQGHVDHVGGVDCFKEEDTEVIAHKNNAACQDDDERIEGFRRMRSFVFFSRIISQSLRALAENPEAVVQSKPVPDRLVDDHYVFELGGLRFELLSVVGGETIDSLAVWLPEHKVAFVGNQFGALFPHFPNLYTVRGDRYRYVLPYLESLERILALEPEVLITGHFEPIYGREIIRAEVERLRDAVVYVHDKTLEGMNQGKDVATLMQEIELPEHLEVGQGYGNVRWAVKTIYESYGGWVQFRSTTELYATEAGAVYADVVELAGGPAPLAARARARLEVGQPLEAIHLCEMALADAPDNREALEVYLEAHQLLLEKGGGENFWETGWLEHQIARTREKL